MGGKVSKRSLFHTFPHFLDILVHFSVFSYRPRRSGYWRQIPFGNTEKAVFFTFCQNLSVIDGFNGEIYAVATGGRSISRKSVKKGQ